MFSLILKCVVIGYFIYLMVGLYLGYKEFKNIKEDK